MDQADSHFLPFGRGPMKLRLAQTAEVTAVLKRSLVKLGDPVGAISDARQSSVLRASCPEIGRQAD
jgi:hypothetical protein